MNEKMNKAENRVEWLSWKNSVPASGQNIFYPFDVPTQADVIEEPVDHSTAPPSPGKANWLVLRIPKVAQRGERWCSEYECVCGTTKIIRDHLVEDGIIKSCGCLSGAAKINGLSKSLLYGVWQGIKQRCYNGLSQSFFNYGYRGISVCNEWRNDFIEFYYWAIQNGYAEGLSIDRENNDGNYEPSNCRWVTMEVQNKNKRPNRLSINY
jgi:hypothetical protein